MISGRVPMRAARRPKRRASTSTTSGPGAMAMPALTMPQPQTFVRNMMLARNIAVNDSPNTAVARLPQRKLGMRNSARSSAGAACDRERTTNSAAEHEPDGDGADRAGVDPAPHVALDEGQRDGADAEGEHAEPTRSGNGPGSASRDSTSTRRPAISATTQTGQVDEEHPAPADGVDEEAADRGAEGGGHGAHRAPDGDGDRDPLAGRRPQHEGQRRRCEGGGADRLHEAAGDQERRRSGASPHSAEAIVNTSEAAEEHPLAAPSVGEPARRHQQGGEHQRVAGEDPRHRVRADVGERRLDGAEGDEQDLGVEEHHEDPEPGDEQRQVGPLHGRRRGRSAVVASSGMLVEIINHAVEVKNRAA